MIYAGIGARDTPREALEVMESIGGYMARNKHTLRSGGAKGADTAFEVGCDRYEGDKEIYLPFKGFNRNSSPLYETCKDARMIAKKYHPAWSNLGNLGRDFMARNVYQIIGKNFDKKVDLVVCWTIDGKVTGGTGQALRMANDLDIPIFNLGKGDIYKVSNDLMKFLQIPF